MLQEKYIEVWNKVDLIREEDEKKFAERIEWASK